MKKNLIPTLDKALQDWFYFSKFCKEQEEIEEMDLRGKLMQSIDDEERSNIQCELTCDKTQYRCESHWDSVIEDLIAKNEGMAQFIYKQSYKVEDIRSGFSALNELRHWAGCNSYLDDDINNSLSVESDELTFQDGGLLYKGKLLDLTGKHVELCKVLFENGANRYFDTIDIEEKVYGYGSEATKQRADNLKKSIQRLNRLLEKQFDLKKVIKYSVLFIKRLV